jgi:hypothetical protein
LRFHASKSAYLGCWVFVPDHILLMNGDYIVRNVDRFAHRHGCELISHACRSPGL